MNTTFRKLSGYVRISVVLLPALLFGIIVGNGHAQSTEGNDESEFTASLGMSDSSGFIDDLMRSGGGTAGLPKKNAFLRGDVISTLFIVENFARDTEGRVNVSAGFDWIKPDGSTMFSKENYSSARGKPPSSITLSFLDPVLELGFDNSDALGAHLLLITVTDHVSGNTVKLREPLMLVTTRQRKNLLNRPIDDAKVLDDLWVDYMEHRDDLPIRRIITVLHLAEEGSGMAMVIGSAARWSLGSQMQQIPEVLQICEKLIPGESGTTRTILEELVDKAKTGAELKPH